MVHTVNGQLNEGFSFQRHTLYSLHLEFAIQACSYWMEKEMMLEDSKKKDRAVGMVSGLLDKTY
jgi:hypothetical protein